MSREEILRRFEDLLDSALAAEEPPHGIDAEILALAGQEPETTETSDAYALWSATTALTQEIKLQGRAFKDLTDAINLQSSRSTAEVEAVFRERERGIQRDAERRARKQILSGLIDLRDRLVRGRESAAAAWSRVTEGSSRGWFARLLRESPADPAQQTIAAVVKGYELALERLDQMLGEFDAREIACKGRPFEPRTMNVVDVEESAAVPEGTVLEVYRSGYEWEGEVFVPAQVKVARTQGAKVT